MLLFCIVEVLQLRFNSRTLFASTFCKACRKSLLCYAAITPTLKMNSDHYVWTHVICHNVSLRSKQVLCVNS